MNKASYIGTSTATGGEGKYPLSTETLDFIQGQILLLEALAGLGGSNYILRAPDGTHEGVAVVTHVDDKGTAVAVEVVTIEATPVFSPGVNYLSVTTTRENIEADGETYLGARTQRRAQFTTSAAKGAENYPISGFANVSGRRVESFPTIAGLAARVDGVRQSVLDALRDVLAEKLLAKTVDGLNGTQMDGLRTACVLSCTRSVALFGRSDYTLITTLQGGEMVRQELVQGYDEHYVRTHDGKGWSAWAQVLDTAMHLDVKIVGDTVWLRHGALGVDCDIVLLRKKRRSAWRRTGGARAYTENRGVRKQRRPKCQYVHFKGIKLSKGEPGKWYVPKCIGVADAERDGDLVGRGLPALCESLFYQAEEGMCRIQGCRKNIVLKSVPCKKAMQHRGYAPIGVQIARLKPTGGKDAGGEIVRMKYRVGQRKCKNALGTVYYQWVRSFSVD